MILDAYAVDMFSWLQSTVALIEICKCSGVDSHDIKMLGKKKTVPCSRFDKDIAMKEPLLRILRLKLKGSVSDWMPVIRPRIRGIVGPTIINYIPAISRNCKDMGEMAPTSAIAKVRNVMAYP